MYRARVGIIETKNGIIDTPGFVPVATQAALKNVDTVTADRIGLQLLFCNTFHLVIHPGTDCVEKNGGLHKFMNHNGPIITDSGGFQIFSMMAGSLNLDKKINLKGAGNKKRPNLVLKINEDGATFRSYRDGKKIFLSPENSIIAQKQLGADIIIPLDHLISYDSTESELLESFERTHRWESRSISQHLDDPRDQAIYCVIHGGLNYSLRKKSVNYLCNLPFDGHAIGGSLGRNRDDLHQLLKFLLPLLPRNKPNHILGIGDTESIMKAVLLGADTFDSSYPTRAARHGQALQKPHERMINMRNSRFRLDNSPLINDCECHTCQNYSRAYIHHLVKAFEPTASSLLAIHNLTCMMRLMKNIRSSIMHGKL